MYSKHTCKSNQQLIKDLIYIVNTLNSIAHSILFKYFVFKRESLNVIKLLNINYKSFGVLDLARAIINIIKMYFKFFDNSIFK